MPFIEPWIDPSGWENLDLSHVKTPCYIVNEHKIIRNAQVLNLVQQKSGCKILMALKSFSMYPVFPLISKYLAGSEASSINEARLGNEYFGKETHVFSPSYTEQNIGEYMKYADHLVFNSFSQWERLRNTVLKSPKHSFGIRVNPEHREAEIAMYDPCAPYSHFGVTRKNFRPDLLDGIEGLHFHTLCELNADSLQRTLKVFEDKFGEFLSLMKWVNFGGGHHITRNDYDTDLLVSLIIDFKKRYPHLQVYLEPGEAIALNAGVLVGTVIDTFYNGVNIGVLNISPTCHMPDVLEIPYLPSVLGAKPLQDTTINEKTYRLVGPTCLTGDVIGHYEFDEPLKVGQKLVFLNMAIYTMVKNNTFNGVDLPSIAVQRMNGTIELIREFGYMDFKERLG